MTKPAIIVAENVNQRLLEKLQTQFEIVMVKNGDAIKVLEPSTVARIRGAVAAGGLLNGRVETLPNMQLVVCFGIGCDNVDLAYASAKGIVVTNTPHVLNDEVADTAIALLLNAIRNFPKAETWIREGKWPENRFGPSRFSLKGRHVGLLGLGGIGLEIAKRLEPFKVELSYHTRTRHPNASYSYHSTLIGLAEAVDTLIAVVPKTPETHKLIDEAVLRALGSEGIVINVGRGWSVDEDALVSALRDGTIGGAGLDVFYNEPNVPAELFSMENVSLLPHIASFSEPTRNAMADLAAQNVISFFESGNAVTPVSLQYA